MDAPQGSCCTATQLAPLAGPCRCLGQTPHTAIGEPVGKLLENHAVESFY